MYLLVARRIDHQTVESSQIRSFSKMFSKSCTYQQQLTAKLRILDKCLTYNHETTWKQIRKQGNTNLFAQTVEYQVWKSLSRPSGLLYLGKLGSGKPVTLANIVDDLNLFVKNRKAYVISLLLCPG
jgi:Tfp pilus assembly pilus retraction ATPase PilT